MFKGKTQRFLWSFSIATLVGAPPWWKTVTCLLAEKPHVAQQSRTHIHMHMYNIYIIYIYISYIYIIYIYISYIYIYIYIIYIYISYIYIIHLYIDTPVYSQRQSLGHQVQGEMILVS